jgi:two-component system, response regulator RegA
VVLSVVTVLVLIVEDNDSLRAALERALAERATVESCASVQQAALKLRSLQPDVVLLDFDLPDGSALDVIRLAAERAPVPAFVAMSGVADAGQAFSLAQLGVRSYLTKPVTLEQVERALESAVGTGPDVTPHVRAAVGRVALKELERVVRETMLSEALARSEGSRRGAARLLDVSRQLLQHMLRRSGRSERTN